MLERTTRRRPAPVGWVIAREPKSSAISIMRLHPLHGGEESNTVVGVNAGYVQFMTAGGGVMNSEMPGPAHQACRRRSSR
jgi:hypothetical protein